VPEEMITSSPSYSFFHPGFPQELQTEEMDRILREGSEVSPDSVLNKGKPHCYAAFTHMVGMT
jgi:hypothetical protein